MDKWQTVEVIVALVALFFAIATPLYRVMSKNATDAQEAVRLNTEVNTRLADAVDRLDKSLEKLSKENSKTHDVLFEKCDKNTEKINDHEARIRVLEEGGGKNEE